MPPPDSLPISGCITDAAHTPLPTILAWYVLYQLEFEEELNLALRWQDR